MASTAITPTTPTLLADIQAKAPPLATQQQPPPSPLAFEQQLAAGAPYLVPLMREAMEKMHEDLEPATAQPPGPRTRLADPRVLLPELRAQQPLMASTSLNSSSSIPVHASLDPAHTRLLLAASEGGAMRIPTELVLRDMLVARYKGCIVAVMPRPPADAAARRVYLTAPSGWQADNWYLALKQLSVGAWH